MVFSVQHLRPVVGAVVMGGVTESGERMIIITSEQPERELGFPDEVSKQTLERYHLERFRADVLLQTGAVPFDAVERGSDPPDFLVHTKAGPTRLDMVALARTDRRNGYRLFEHLQRRLQGGAGGRDFSGVAGCILSVWFGTSLIELPPKRGDDALIAELLDLVAACRVDHQAHVKMMETVAQQGFPELYPPIIATATTSGKEAGFIANVFLPPERAAEMPGGLGFQVQLHMPMQVTETVARAELISIVEKHDKRDIEHLVVSAGAPDAHGVRFPAEELIAALLFEEDPPIVQTSHLRRVTVHLWSRRDAIDVSVEKRMA